MSSNSKLLFEKIQLLKDNSGIIGFSLGDYYIQFAKERNEKEIHFEAVSHYFLDILTPSLEKDFEKLGFIIHSGENYSKTVADENWEDIITDTQTIFETIYKVNYNKQFEVIADIEILASANDEVIDNGVTQPPVQKTNYFVAILIFIIVVFLVFKIFSKEKNQNSTLVNNTTKENTYSKSPDTNVRSTSENKTGMQIDDSICESEKKYMTQYLELMNKMISDAAKMYENFRNDEIKWSKYIRNWNIDMQRIYKDNDESNFKCFNSFYFGKSLYDAMQIGLAYGFDDLQSVGNFEKILNDDIKLAIKEIKN